MVFKPALASLSAAEAPAGPPPRTATVFIILLARLAGHPASCPAVQEWRLPRMDVRGAVARPRRMATEPDSRAGPQHSPPAIDRHAARACTSSPFHDSHCCRPLDERQQLRTPYSFRTKWTWS